MNLSGNECYQLHFLKTTPTRKINNMSVGSLFSGIGGIELGFEAEGYETKWFVERDEYAKAILRKHWPNAVIYDDVTKINWSTVPKVDILTGGFPCQDISNAGKRAGITGSRSSLWKYYCEAIRILRPKYALIENVAALVNRGLDVVLADIAKVGYDAEWYNLSASAVGAPHRRERIFILAYPNSSMQGKYRSSIFGTDEKNGRKLSGNLFSVCREVSTAYNVENSDERGLQTESTEQQTTRTAGANTQDAGWWAVEPELDRVAHGVPNRVDRIKCLGNAVVPQCAQVFAQAIKEYEEINF